MNNVDPNIIYLTIGPVLILLNGIGCYLLYLLRDDLKNLIAHFDMRKINKSLILKTSIDKEILVPLALSIVSFRKSLKQTEFNTIVFGAFGSSLFINAAFFVYLGFTKNAPVASNPSFSLAVATVIGTCLSLIIIVFNYFNIKTYSTHKNDLDTLIDAVELRGVDRS